MARADIAILGAQQLLKPDKLSVSGEVHVSEWTSLIFNCFQKSGKKLQYYHGLLNLDEIAIAKRLRAKILILIFHNCAKADQICIESTKSIADAQEYSIDEIRKIFGNEPPRIVISISKHAEPATMFFEKLDVPHIVGLRYEYSVTDYAVQSFLTNFLQSILQEQTIQNSFLNAYLSTINQFNNGVGYYNQKFWLYGAGHSSLMHDVLALPDLSPGTPQRVWFTTGNYSIPPRRDQFLCRYKSLYTVLKKIEKEDLLWIHGPEGWGKSSLAIEAANYLKERRTFPNILYCDFQFAHARDTPSRTVANIICGQNLPAAFRDRSSSQASVGKFTLPFGFTSIIKNTEQLAGALGELDGTILLVIDHISLTRLHEVKDFCKSLLMNSQNKNIKILAVSRKKPVLNGYIGDEFAMSSMNKRAAVRLLTGLILQEIKDDEYPNKSELELRRMFSYHPAGYLVEKYHVPKAIEQISRLINEKGTICNLTGDDLREMANVTMPFHDDLYATSESKATIQQNAHFVGGNPMQIFIRPSSSGGVKTLVLDVFQETKIRHIKQALCEGISRDGHIKLSDASDVQKVPVAHQSIAYSEHWLDDSKTLKELGIWSESTLSMSVRFNVTPKSYGRVHFNEEGGVLKLAVDNCHYSSLEHLREKVSQHVSYPPFLSFNGKDMSHYVYGGQIDWGELWPASNILIIMLDITRIPLLQNLDPPVKSNPNSSSPEILELIKQLNSMMTQFRGSYRPVEQIGTPRSSQAHLIDSDSSSDEDNCFRFAPWATAPVRDVKRSPSNKLRRSLIPPPPQYERFHTTNPRDWSAQDVSDWISTVGAAYSKYDETIIANSLCGQTIIDVLDELCELLLLLGFSKLHSKVFKNQFQRAMKLNLDRED